MKASSTYKIVILILSVLLQGCTSESDINQEAPISPNRAPNILVIVGDDMGRDTLSGLQVGAEPPQTPNLDRLIGSGIVFDNFWVQPSCSPTRAAILTGRYGFRTNIGRPVGGPIGGDSSMGLIPEPPPKPEGASREIGGGSPLDFPVTWGLRTEEFGLPKAFDTKPELGYNTAAIGKWHLADVRNGWENHPNQFGFDHFSGLLRGTPDSYFSWTKVVDGEFVQGTGYTETDKVDDALGWINAQDDNPWFMWLSFNLPHTPLHLPPNNLLVKDYSSLDPQADPNEKRDEYFTAMVEALDAEIGRLLSSMDGEELANTYIIFLGDNGSTGQTIRSPYGRDQAKGSVYQGGINTPLIIAGPRVRGGERSQALVSAVDLFATIQELSGIDPNTTSPVNARNDSVSFYSNILDPQAESPRTWIYSDTFDPETGIEEGEYAIRERTFKLVHREADEFYNLIEDPYEKQNLLVGQLSDAERRVYEALKAEVEALHATER